MSKFDEACADHGGATSLKHKRGYQFPNLASARNAATELGLTFNCELSDDREAELYIDRFKRTWLRVDRHGEDSLPYPWTNAESGKYSDVMLQASTLDERNWDDQFRAIDIRKSNNLFEGDQYRAKVNIGEADEHWSRFGASSVRCMLQYEGLDRTAADRAMGHMHCFSWEEVCLPFQPEYPVPGKRIWNPNAPRLRYEPAEGPHPHWDRIFDHVGREMDSVLPYNSWAVANSIKRGADWLMLLYASIVREPYTRTPYLFLFGPEDSGKSIVHEGFELLVTGGVVKADRALTNNADFNGELDGAILCVVEEKNLSRSAGALAKIKDAVTALKLSIRKMRRDSFMIDNMTHWIQCANNRDACVVNPGCTRIQTLHVAELQALIPKEILVEALKAEGPAITHTLLNLPLPKPEGRLALQLVETPSRVLLANENVDDFVVEVADFAHLGDWDGEPVLFGGQWTECSWVGTAAELANALNEIRGYADAPRDARALTKRLTNNKTYLQSRNVVFDVGQRTKKGVPFTLKLTSTPQAAK